jgi:hypothetical protein
MSDMVGNRDQRRNTVTVTEGRTSGDWVELRDQRGKLCARVERGAMLLEVRRNGETAVFDLLDYLHISEY